jgi:hypothetical protein
MNLRTLTLTSLAALTLGHHVREEPTIIHLRWMHRINGMTPLQEREARKSNEHITAVYDSLVATLGPGQFYAEGFSNDEEINYALKRHAIEHRFRPNEAYAVDSASSVDGPLMHRINEGKLPIRAAETQQTIAAYESAIGELFAHQLYPYIEAREDATIARIMREKPRVAYVLYGCTHDLADAVARGANGYKLLTITTPEVERERGCDPKTFEIEQP